jgi:hypothetical protein
MHQQTRDTMLPQKIGSLPRTRNKRDFGRYLRLLTAIGYNRHRPEIALRWQAGTRIKQVMLEDIPLPPVTACNTGSGDGPVMQGNRPGAISPWHSNRPVILAWRQTQHGQIAARVDQRRIDTVRTQFLQGSINRHALRNSTKLESYCYFFGKMTLMLYEKP